MLHAVSTAGWSFPASDRETLAGLVVASPRSLSTPATIAVTGLLAGAVATVIAGATSPMGPAGPIKLAHDMLAAVLAVRGARDLVESTLCNTSATPEFRRWDRALHSPACLTLAGTVFLSTGCRR
ncbi:MAG: DUF3995 domain-containing protein [Acidimicrobiales bacterium]|nr:DUF3995 domain-containing protein [Acidimicrobiales bacterium]